jgi:hypothetical protein
MGALMVRAFLLMAVLVLTGPALGQQVPQRNFISGSGSGTDTNPHNIIAAPSITGARYYITGIQCGRTDAGTSASRVTLNDDAATVIVLPNAGNGGGANVSFPVPLTVPRATALTMTSSASISTVYCSAQGFLAN